MDKIRSSRCSVFVFVFVKMLSKLLDIMNYSVDGALVISSSQATAAPRGLLTDKERVLCHMVLQPHYGT